MNLPVNSRLLCQLSYAGSTRIRLAHPGRACNTTARGDTEFTGALHDEYDRVIGEGHGGDTRTSAKGVPGMRYRATFIAGFAVGFIAGARAGRERYEQIKAVSRKVAENPAVRKTAQAAGQKAVQLGHAAGDKAAAKVPKLTETAKTSASKVRGQLDRLPGRHAADADQHEPATVNGTRPH